MGHFDYLVYICINIWTHWSVREQKSALSLCLVFSFSTFSNLPNEFRFSIIIYVYDEIFFSHLCSFNGNNNTNLKNPCHTNRVLQFVFSPSGISPWLFVTSKEIIFLRSIFSICLILLLLITWSGWFFCVFVLLECIWIFFLGICVSHCSANHLRVNTPISCLSIRNAV